MAIISIASLVGLIGGLLVGIWDGFVVILWHAPRPVDTSDMFVLGLYSAALYAATGFIIMVAVGAVTAAVLRVGRRRVDMPRLTGVFIGIFVLLATYVLLPLGSNWVEVVERLAISAASALALAGVSIYLLRKGVRGDVLATLCISSMVWVSVLLYGGLWLNSSVLREQELWGPILASVGLLVVVTLLAVVLLRLSLFVFRNYDARRTRQVSQALLGVMASALIAVSVVGPFGFESGSEDRGLGGVLTTVDGTVENPSKRDERPNILWIVIDTLRADHLSCYGYDKETTPNIDKIASEGTLYENVISTSSWTLPSHASMFTSMFPGQHGADAEHWWLDDRFETIAEVLSSQGYLTLAHSSNLIVGPRANLVQGFDKSIVTRYGKTHPEPEPELPELLRLKEYIRDLLRSEPESVAGRGFPDDGAYRTNETVKAWVTDSQRADKPFFIFINYMEVHAPYHPPREYAIRYLPDNVDPVRALWVNQNASPYIAGTVKMGDKDFAILRALYDGEIEYLDFRIGELVDHLRSLDILDDTVLIITSDHGENFGEHQLMGHVLCLYDTLVRVPLIIRYPETFDPGMRVDEVVQLTDIFPTILDIVDIDSDGNEQLQGHSLLMDTQRRDSPSAVAELAIWAWVLDGVESQSPDTAVSEYSRRLKAVQDGEYKYIWASDGRDELYNTCQDPDELDNLIESEPEKASELRGLLIESLNSFDSYWPWNARQVE